MRWNLSVLVVESHGKETSIFDNNKWNGIVCTQTHYFHLYFLFVSASSNFVLTTNKKTKQNSYVNCSTLICYSKLCVAWFETPHAREKCATSESTAVPSTHTHTVIYRNNTAIANVGQRQFQRHNSEFCDIIFESQSFKYGSTKLGTLLAIIIDQKACQTKQSNFNQISHSQ